VQAAQDAGAKVGPTVLVVECIKIDVAVLAHENSIGSASTTTG
jgi:hypothetical protein